MLVAVLKNLTIIAGGVIVGSIMELKMGVYYAHIQEQMSKATKMECLDVSHIAANVEGLGGRPKMTAALINHCPGCRQTKCWLLWT